MFTNDVKIPRRLNEDCLMMWICIFGSILNINVIFDVLLRGHVIMVSMFTLFSVSLAFLAFVIKKRLKGRRFPGLFSFSRPPVVHLSEIMCRRFHLVDTEAIKDKARWQAEHDRDLFEGVFDE